MSVRADYSRDVEGSPGLVVHEPLIATLLLDSLERELLARLQATFVADLSPRRLPPSCALAARGDAISADPDGDTLVR